MKLQKQTQVYLLKKRPVRQIDVVQGDTGIQLVFDIMDFSLPSGTTARLYVQKPSGKFVYQTKYIDVSGNTVTVDLHNQAIIEHGKCGYQVQLVNGSDTITTFCGIMLVEKSLADAGAEESKTVVSAFEELTAQQIAEIQIATQAQIALVKDAAEEKKAEVLASIPGDYTETYNLANAANREKADAIVCEAEGKTINVADASNDHIRGLKLFGKSSQLTTKGYQLFDSGAIGANLYTSIYDDGVIAFDIDNTDGTSDKYATFYTPVSNLLKESTQYAVVAEVFSTNNVGGTVYLTSHYSEELSQFEDTASLTNPAVGVHVKLAKTYSEFTTCKYMCRGFVSCPAGKHLSMSLRISVLEDTSTTADSFVYEPFSGGAASPCPEWTQEIENIGDNGTVKVGITAKNIAFFEDAIFANCKLLDAKSGTVQMNMTSATFAEITLAADICKYLLANQGKPIYLRVANIPTDAALNLVIVGERIKDNRGPDSYQEINGGKGENVVALLPVGFSRIDSVKLRVGRKSVAYADTTTVYSNISLSFGDMSEFEPAEKLQELTVSTPNGLPGIPVTSGGNYVDENGQGWICDEIDFERGVYVQRCILFDNFEVGSSVDTPNHTKYHCTHSSNLIGKSVRAAFCTHTNEYAFHTGDMADVGHGECFVPVSFPDDAVVGSGAASDIHNIAGDPDCGGICVQMLRVFFGQPPSKQCPAGQGAVQRIDRGTSGYIRIPAEKFITAALCAGCGQRAAVADKSLHPVCKRAAVGIKIDISVRIADFLIIDSVEIHIGFAQAPGNQAG